MTTRTLPAAPARPAVAPATAARAAGIAHYASLVLAYPALLWLGRDMWFRLDEWNIVLGHSPGSARWYDVFAPFDVHWSTVPVLFYRAVGHFVGASQYLPYMGVTLAAFVLSVHLVWRVLNRCGADPWVSTLLAAALLVLGAGWESMYWVLIVDFTLPLCCVFGAVLLGDRDDVRARHRIGIATLALVAAMCSGAGVAMVVVPFLVVTLRRGWRDGLTVVAPAALAYAIWLALTGSGILDHAGGANRGDSSQVGRFVLDGLTGSLSTLVRTRALGVAAVIALVLWIILRGRRRLLPAPVIACGLGALAVFLLTAVGRANGGDATLPHYVATGIALLMPAVALAVTDLLGALQRVQIARAGVLAGLAAVIGLNAASLVHDANAAAADDRASRNAILAAAYVLQHDPHDTLPASYPETQLAWAVSTADVQRLVRRGDLRAPASVPESLRAEIALRLHVAVQAEAADHDAPPVVTANDQATLTGDGICSTASSLGGTPFVVAVQFPQRGSLQIVPLTAVEMHPYLRGSRDRPDDQEQPTILLAPNQARYLVDTQPGTTVYLLFSSGSVRLCPQP